MPCSAPTPPPGAPDGFEAWEVDTAKAVVRSFIAAHGAFAKLDFDDLVQDCLFHWWLKRDRYEETRGTSRRTFMNRVLTNRLRDLRREELAEKRRGDREARSLDEPLDYDGDSPSLADLLPDETADARPEDRVEQAELRERIALTREHLPSRQRALLDHLLAGENLSDVSRSLSTPRATLYDDMRRIRTVFEAEGLRDFLR